MNKWNNKETLDHYKGQIWISKIFKTENRGNVCFHKDNDFHVIAYIDQEEVRKEGLDEAILSRVEAQGLIYLLEENV